MSVASAFTGFEIQYGANGGRDSANQLLFDILKSRSGCGCHREYRITSGSGSTTTFPNWPTMAAVTAGQQGKCRSRIFLRVMTSFSVQRTIFHAQVGSSSSQLAGLSIRSDNKFTCWYHNGSVLTEGTASINAAPSGDWNGWVQIDYTLTLTEAGSSDAIALSAALTFPNGNQETITMNTTASLGSFAVASPNLWASPNVYPTSVSWTGDVYVDDWWVAAATNADVATMPDFPIGTHICLARITGQGSDTAWTGDWSAASKQSIFDAVTEEKQTVTGVGFKTSFIHQTAADLGITGSIYGLMLHQEALGGAGTTRFRLDGATVNGNGTITTSLTNSPWYFDGTIRTPTAFDALQWGVESHHASTQHRLYGMNVEVLHDGLAKPPIYLDLGQGYRHKWITYTGDGSGRLPVIGVGFRSTFVMIQSINGTHAVVARNIAVPYTHGAPQGILSMDADGFSVGKSVATNDSGQKYAALCIRDDGIADDNYYEFQFRQGSLGSSSAIEEFSHSTACLLKALFIMPASSAVSPNSFLQIPDTGGLSVPLVSGGPSNTGMTLDANGFHAGTSTAISNNAELALYWGWADTDDVANFLAVGEIPPNTIDVTIPVVFTEPLYWVLAHGNNSAEGIRHNDVAYSGANCGHWASSVISSPSRIIALTNTSFTIDGTTGAMLTGSVECWWVALAGAGQVVPDTAEAVFASGSITHPLTWMEFTDRDNNLEIFAEVDLCDRGTYYGGYKQPRVVKFESIRRGLSDPQGQIEHLAFGATMSDTDCYFRGLLGNITGRYMTNRPLVQRMIDDEDRRQELTPRMAAVGFVSNYEPLPNFQFRMSGQDWLKKKYMRRRDSLQSWQKKVTLVDFPNAVGAFETEETSEGAGGSSIKFDSVGDVIPIIYGRITDTNYTDDASGDDSGDGQFVPIYVGDYDILGESWRGALVAAHHCAYIEEGYIDNDPIGIATNPDWLTPRNAALWAAAGFTTPWTTINGQDYCLIYVKGGAGDKFIGRVPPRDALCIPFAINIWGRTDTGDDTGTLITDGFDAYLDFLRNYVAPITPWTSGVPLDLPLFPTVDHTLVDVDSFAACKTEATARVSGGYVLDFAVQKPMNALDIIAAFNKNLDCEGYFKRNGQYAVSMEPVSLVSGAEKITDILDILAGTFKIIDEIQTNFFNVIPYVHTEDYCGRSSTPWRSGALEIRDAISIANYDQERASGIFDFWMIRGRNRASDSEFYNQGTAMVADVVARILKRYSNVRRVVTLALPFTGLMYELGDIFPLTSVEGIGANGWINRTIRVLRHEVFPSEGKVLLDCYDLEVVLGDFFHAEAVLTILAQGSLNTAVTMKGSAVLVLTASATFGTMKGAAILSITASGVLEVTGIIPLFVSFGGSSFEWKQSPTPDWVSANPVQVVLNSASIPSLSGVVTVRLAAATGDVTARLRDVTNNVTSGTSSMVVAPGMTYVTVDFPVTLSSGIATYEIQLLPSLVDTDVNLGSGYLEIF